MSNEVIKALRGIKKKVYLVLLKFPETRDNNKLLILRYWACQDSTLREEETTFRYFADKFLNNDFQPPQTILRESRILQRKYPEVRGKTFMDRCEESKEVQYNIKKID